MKTLRGKIFAVILLTLVPLSLFLTLWSVGRVRRQLEEEFKLRGLALTRTAMYILSREGTPAAAQFFDSLLADPDVREAVLFSPRGTPLFVQSRSSTPPVPDPELWHRAMSSFTPQMRLSARNLTIYQRIWTEAPGGIRLRGVWAARLDLYRMERNVGAMALAHAGAAAGSFLLALLLGLWLSRRLTRPLERLRASAEAASRGDFSRRLEWTRGDELGALARSFDQMSAKLDIVFSRMQQPVLLADADGVIALKNAAAERFFPLSGGGPTLTRAFEGLEAEPPLPAILASDAPVVDFYLSREEPRPLVLSCKASRIEFEGKTGRLYLLTDVTEEQQDQRLKHSFLSLISHKLYTPLSVIIGSAQTLQDGAAGPDETLAIAGMIAAHGRRLSDLVEKLLRFSRLRQLGPSNLAVEEVDVDALLIRLVDQLDEAFMERGATVELGRLEGFMALGDADLLKSAVHELLENAVKFDPALRKRVRLSSRREDERVLICVEDSGPGIPPEDQERVFSQFYQSERAFSGQVEGLGLGLAFVRKVADAHGGTLTLESGLKRGTKVTIALPAAPAPAGVS